MEIIYEKRDVSIVFVKTPHLSPTPHIHRQIELIYVAEGEVTAVADRKQYRLKSGDLFVSFPNQIHYYKDCEMGEYYLSVFSRHALLELAKDFKGVVPEENCFHINEDDITADTIKRLIECTGPNIVTKRYGYLNVLMADILPRCSTTPSGQTDRAAIQKIINFCHANYTREISLDDAADELHLSKYYISHTVSKQLGLTFGDFINTLRIDAACAALEEDDRKISDIAGDVGYGSIRTFNRIFKENTSLTPYEYRQKFKKEK